MKYTIQFLWSIPSNPETHFPRYFDMTHFSCIISLTKNVKSCKYAKLHYKILKYSTAKHASQWWVNNVTKQNLQNRINVNSRWFKCWIQSFTYHLRVTWWLFLLLLLLLFSFCFLFWTGCPAFLLYNLHTFLFLWLLWFRGVCLSWPALQWQNSNFLLLKELKEWQCLHLVVKIVNMMKFLTLRNQEHGINNGAHLRRLIPYFCTMLCNSDSEYCTIWRPNL